MKTLCLLAAAVGLAIVVATPCRGQEPADSEKIAELRREVQELRGLVAELLKKMEAQEYERMPRIENVRIHPPTYHPVAVPVEPNSKLRFPYSIERGTAAPLSQRHLR